MGPLIASTIMPNNAKRRTIPSHVDNGARECAISRMDSVLAISVDGLHRFDQTWIADREERSFGNDSEINERERCADGDERKQIPDTGAKTSAVKSWQHDQIDVEHLHEENPTSHNRKLVRMCL